MQDVQKLFELIKTSRNENDTLKEIESKLSSPSEYPTIITTGYKPSTSGAPAGFSGYSTSSGGDSEQRESSLFAYAVALNKLCIAAMLLKKLGNGILFKSNDRQENGFHAVANCSNEAFRSWFLNESNLIEVSVLSDQIKDAVNKINSSDQHLLVRLFTHKLGLEELIQWIKIGVDPLVPTKYYDNILNLACETNRQDMVRYLCESYPALLRERNEKGQMPIYFAAGNESPDLIKLLIHARSPTSVEDNVFNRPLHHAVARGRVSAAGLILQQEKMITLPSGKSVPYAGIHNGSLETPLHILVTHHKYYTETSFSEMLNLLMQHGADLSAVNDKGMTPIKLAKEEKLPTSFFELLWSYYADELNAPLFSTQTLTKKICQYYSANDAQMLLQALHPLFKADAGNPFQTLQQEYTDHLKGIAPLRYPNQPHIVQSFNIVLDQLVSFSRDRLEQNQAQGPAVTFQYQSQFPSREDSSMNIQGNYPAYKN